MVSRFVKKPVVIEAQQWVPEHHFRVQVMEEWLNKHGVHYMIFDDGTIGIGTLESGDDLDRHKGKPYDWVIKGIKGEFYVCDKEVFDASYDWTP